MVLGNFTLLNVFLAIAVDNVGKAMEKVEMEELEADEEEERRKKDEERRKEERERSLSLRGSNESFLSADRATHPR